jgi:hypothetical protein
MKRARSSSFILHPSASPSPAPDIQKPGHIVKAYACVVQAQAQVAQSHEELVLELRELRDISRPTHLSVQQAIEEVVAVSQTLTRLTTDLQALISRPLG